jgi:2,3-diphosphopglycerate-independent phosphoglycerate mutase
MKPGKLVLVILDGLGDTTHHINGQNGTCLQLSTHPVLDAFARTGKVGLMDAVSPGYACGSDTAHLSMFGYPPFTYYNGRGAFEALGGGMPMDPGDIAFKSNFSTMYGDIVKYRRCDRHFEYEGPILCRDLDGLKIPEFPEVGVSVVYATEHRCAVRIRAPGMSDRITGTDPIHDDRPLELSQPLEDAPEQIYTAKIVNALSTAFRRALTEHPINQDRIAHGKEPANVILLRGPGMRLNVETFDQRHNIKAFLIAPTAIIAGLGISVGLPVIKVEGATGDMDSNFDAKTIAAAKLLEGTEYDMGIIHMKGIDDASHDGKPSIKMELIERADRAIRILIEKLSQYEISTGEHFVIGVVADHSTSSTWLDHTFEPVPVCFSEVCSIAKDIGVPHKEFDARYIEPDNVSRYTEVDACHGSLGRFCGAKLMELLFHYAGRDGISH